MESGLWFVVRVTSHLQGGDGPRMRHHTPYHRLLRDRGAAVGWQGERGERTVEEGRRRGRRGRDTGEKERIECFGKRQKMLSSTDGTNRQRHVFAFSCRIPPKQPQKTCSQCASALERARTHKSTTHTHTHTHTLSLSLTNTHTKEHIHKSTLIPPKQPHQNAARP